MFNNDVALLQFRLSKSHHGRFLFLKNYVFLCNYIFWSALLMVGLCSNLCRGPLTSLMT